MKIKYKDEPTIVTFGELKSGDVFRTTCDETVYMKFMEITHKNGICNCVSLQLGEPTFCADYDEVVLLNATLVIE